MDRQQAQVKELKLLHEAAKTEIHIGLVEMKEKLLSAMDDKVSHIERVFSSEIIQKLETIEEIYKSNLNRVEGILARTDELAFWYA